MEPGTLLFAAIAFLLGIAVTAWRRRRLAQLVLLPETPPPPPMPFAPRASPWPMAGQDFPRPPAPGRRRLLASRSEARRAIVLMTVLGPCRAVEGWDRK